MKRDNKKETTCWDKTEIEKFSYSSKTFLNVDFCPKKSSFCFIPTIGGAPQPKSSVRLAAAIFM